LPGLLLLFDFNDLFALIVATMRADMVGSPQIVAVGTFGQVWTAQGKVAAAAIPPAFGQFPFW
jgi:hypothetical protein